jgi:hypothetical protein
MTDTCRNLLDRVEPKDLTQIALQMLFTIERMELIIPEITDTIRKALEQGRPTHQPEPVALTDEKLYELWNSEGIEADFQDCRRFARAYAARYSRPTVEPVPVAERPWEREGWCDAEGRCYGWDGDYWWMVGNPGAANETITHCLPHYALPTPEATND